MYQDCAVGDSPEFGCRQLMCRSIRHYVSVSARPPGGSSAGQRQLAVSPQDAGLRAPGRGIVSGRGQPWVAGLTYGSLGGAPVEVTGDRIVPNATVDSQGLTQRPASANRT